MSRVGVHDGITSGDSPTSTTCLVSTAACQPVQSGGFSLDEALGSSTNTVSTPRSDSEMDGAVLKVNSLSRQGELGFTSRAPPRRLHTSIRPKRSTPGCFASTWTQEGPVGSPFGVMEPVLVSGSVVEKALSTTPTGGS